MSPRIQSYGSQSLASTDIIQLTTIVQTPPSSATASMTVGGSARQPSTTDSTIVLCVVRLSIPDGSDGTVNLELSQDGSTGWTAHPGARNSFDVTGLIGLTGTNLTEQTLVAVVPPGWRYRLVGSGGGTKTVVRTTEVYL